MCRNKFLILRNQKKHRGTIHDRNSEYLEKFKETFLACTPKRQGFIVINASKCQKMIENIRKCQKMLENTRKRQKMLENVRTCQKMIENDRKHYKMLENVRK